MAQVVCVRALSARLVIQAIDAIGGQRKSNFFLCNLKIFENWAHSSFSFSFILISFVP